MMIAKYIELRDKVEKKTKAYEEDIKQDRDSMQLLESLLTQEINRLGGQAIKTEFGTAYRSEVMSYRVVNREAWFKFIFDGHHDQLLTTHLAKDAVTEAWGQNGPLPGLDAATIWKTHVRRADQ
jgi:hypothetical protein